MANSISRRQFLATSAAVGASVLLPSGANAGITMPSGGGPYWDRFLILIELDGGNDGLNTVIPYDVPEYKGTGSVPSRRPNLKYGFSPSSATYLGMAPLCDRQFRGRHHSAICSESRHDSSDVCLESGYS